MIARTQHAMLRQSDSQTAGNSRSCTNPAQFAPFSGSTLRNTLAAVFIFQQDSWWAHLDSNQGPTDYESAALTAELWALG